MTDLTKDDFSAFFQAIHGYQPFPWQSHLAELVIDKGRWPALVDLPTAAGKTGLIDIAVFHIACEAKKKEARCAPIRILFVIDRRIVVDAAFERAKKIAECLTNPTQDVLRSVSDNLRLLAGPSNPPLSVVRLRGGTPQERDFVRSPSQPMVLVSTIDQAGSRFLFRGYGVSKRMWPVHAGLLGSDALWILDEVHLSKPFEDTLASVHTIGEKLSWKRLAPFGIVRLSATPGKDKPADCFPESGFDIHIGTTSVFLRRLSAHKRTALVEARGDYAGEFVTQALHLAGLPVADEGFQRKKERRGDLGAYPEARRVAVIVNRVNLARCIFERIVSATNEIADVILLTGRVRPLDRDRIIAQLKPLMADERRNEVDRPFFLVSTQTIEAGADIDVDALVSEIAPLDCLRQRFGRLDRLGLRQESRAVIIYPTGSPQKGKLDRDNPWTAIQHIYDDSPVKTKEWLSGFDGRIDFGTDSFQEKIDTLIKGRENRMEDLLAPHRLAPVLLLPYIELWNRTSPAPDATPEPSLFLHGPDIQADVMIVWRADIDPTDEKSANFSLSLCPPSSLETMTVPIWAAQRWLLEEEDEDVADVAGTNNESTFGPKSNLGKPVLRLGGDTWKKVSVKDLIPGDMIVVPSSYGGCDRWGWNPKYRGEVADMGPEGHYLLRLKGVLRLTQATIKNSLIIRNSSHGGQGITDIWNNLLEYLAVQDDEVKPNLICDALERSELLPNSWRQLISVIRKNSSTIEFYDDDDRNKGFILYSTNRLDSGMLKDTVSDSEAGAESVTEFDESIFQGRTVTLSDHLRNVGQRAEDFAIRMGLNESLVRVLRLAGSLHDLGKAERRFQADLYGLNSITANGFDFVEAFSQNMPLLAKSGGSYPSIKNRMARVTPIGFRHEALSVSLAEKHPEVAKLSETEKDIVLWLIGTHHGYGRPFFPSFNDTSTQADVIVELDGFKMESKASHAIIKLDSGWFERADRLARLFGPWELARLESILRLADHTVSSEERQYSQV